MVKTIAIVSLSAGTLGEAFAAHELPIGEHRLAQYGVHVKYMPHARRGIEFLRMHPEARTDFGVSGIGTVMPQHEEQGFLHLQGAPVFAGEILGGCIDTIYDVFNTERYADSAAVCRKYGVFPPLADWKGKILLLETSEEQPSPARYRAMLTTLKDYGLLDVVAGLLIGKPMNEHYAAEYHAILREVVDDPMLPIVANLNVGHATPRCIVPLGVPAVVDAAAQQICFDV